MVNSDPHLKKFFNRLTKTIERDALIQQTTDELREFFKIDRVVLYYFYREWKGQVTFESLRDDRFSILGLTEILHHSQQDLKNRVSLRKI